jgi:hypothetical protein
MDGESIAMDASNLIALVAAARPQGHIEGGTRVSENRGTAFGARGVEG